MLRFALATLVLFLIAVPAAAQNHPYSPCDNAVARDVVAKVQTLDGAPQIGSFFCKTATQLSSGVANYVFDVVSDSGARATVSVIFETQNNAPVLLGAIYAANCPQKECARGWLNTGFLATGKGDPNGSWTIIQESDPRATIQATMDQSETGFEKRNQP